VVVLQQWFEGISSVCLSLFARISLFTNSKCLILVRKFVLPSAYVRKVPCHPVPMCVRFCVTQCLCA